MYVLYYEKKNPTKFKLKVLFIWKKLDKIQLNFYPINSNMDISLKSLYNIHSITIIKGNVSNVK